MKKIVFILSHVGNYFAHVLFIHHPAEQWNRYYSEIKIMKVESKGKIISMQMNYQEEI